MKKFTKYALLLLTPLMLLAFISSEKSREEALPQHKIVMQLTADNPKVYKGLLKQLNNLKNGWGDSVVIEVVVHGPGMSMMRESTTTFADDIAAAQKRGVIFAICENTLKFKKIPVEDLLPGVTFVPMGIAEIVEKQEAGWSYIKAG